jgi:hypothetical protein
LNGRRVAVVPAICFRSGSDVPMKYFFSFAFLFQTGLVNGQDKAIDNWVKWVDSLRSVNKLVQKQFPYKSFSGSLVGYYLGESLLMINTVVYEKKSGTETEYYVKNGILQKALIMVALFESPKDRSNYHGNHKKNLDCAGCHYYPSCERTTVVFSMSPYVSFYSKISDQDHHNKDSRAVVEEVKKKYGELAKVLKEM